MSRMKLRCTRRGLNSRPQVHKTRALTELRHTCSQYITLVTVYIHFHVSNLLCPTFLVFRTLSGRNTSQYMS